MRNLPGASESKSEATHVSDLSKEEGERYGAGAMWSVLRAQKVAMGGSSIRVV